MASSNTSTLAAHLQRLEASLLDPAVRRDREKVASLLAEDFREFGSSGRVWSRDETLHMLETEEYTPLTMENFQCSQLSEGVALVTYRSLRTDPSAGRRSGALRSSIWVQEGSSWRIVFHQGTRAAES
jgi:hypothetical protein